MGTSHVERAMLLREKGCNCAQAVALAFQDDVDIDPVTLFKITEGFGGGMGGYDGTCGAISGAIAIISLVTSSGTVEQPTKAATYAKAKHMFSLFVQKNHSSVCKELRGLETGKELRSCPGCIVDALEIACAVMGW